MGSNLFQGFGAALDNKLNGVGGPAMPGKPAAPVYSPGSASPLSTSLFWQEPVVVEDNSTEGASSSEIVPQEASTNTWISFERFGTEDALNEYYCSNKIRERANPEGKPFFILCCYNTASSEGELKTLLIRLSDELGTVYANYRFPEFEKTIDHIVSWIIKFGASHDGFSFSLNTIEDALMSSIPFNAWELLYHKRLPDDGQKKLYEDNYKRLMKITGNPAVGSETEIAIRSLCAVIAKLKTDVLETYNAQTNVLKGSDTIGKGAHQLTAGDLRAMERALLKMSRTVGKFRESSFKTSDDLLNFVTRNFLDQSASGNAIGYVMPYPFEGLTLQKRIDFLRLLADASPLKLSGLFNRGLILKGDITLALLLTVKEPEQLPLLNDLNTDKTLFDLLNAADDELRANFSRLISGMVLNALQKEGKMGERVIAAQSTGNFFFYDPGADKKQYAYRDADKKQIVIKNDGHIYKPYEKGAKAYQEDESDYLDKYTSTKTAFDPLELMVVTAEHDIKNQFLELKKDDITLMPACMLYTIIATSAEERFEFLAAISLAVIFLPVNVGVLVAAIEAASAIGVLVAVTDIAADVSIVVASDPGFKSDHPDAAKIMNTAAFLWGLGRLGYAARGVPKALANVNLIAAIKQRAKQGADLIEAIRNGGKTDELFREIFKLIEKGELSAYQFNKIAKRIEADAGVKMHLIDSANREFKELYAKMEANPVYAVFHSRTFKNGRYGIVLEGPAIYFLKSSGVGRIGGIRLTSYTVQHELFHVKLWYKMVKEFGNKVGNALYDKIPNWLHEADVIGEFLKENMRRPGKWKMDDIENDLKTFNRNLERHSDKEAWGAGFKQAIGKNSAELEDFKNWDITTFLKKN